LPRKLYTWKLKNREIRLGERTLIMAVLNVTPDSFSDGGLYQDPDRAFARALELEELGADIIDIGAESTKPGSVRISAAEEIRRLIPVLKRLKGELRIPISVDTYKAEVAELAIEHGAEIINDPSGFTWDPLLAKTVVQNDAGLILNHMRGTPETWGKLGPIPDVMLAVTKDLDASISRARRAGVDRISIVLDPGLGFGKRKEQNAEIIARLADLAKLEYPILVGPSRKSFLTSATSSELETKYATAAAVTAAVLAGAHMVRVHDVAEMKAALVIADEVLRAIPVPGETPEQSSSPVRRSSPQAPATEKSKPPRPKLRLLREVEPAPPPPEIKENLEKEKAEEEEFEEVNFWDDPAAQKSAEKPYDDKPARAPAERPAAAPRKYAPRSGPPRDFRPSRDDKPKRSFGPPRGDRPQRSGPPRFGPARSGPPRDDRPARSGPPRDDRPPRSGPPRDDSRREWSPSGPPRSGPPGSRPPRPGGPSRFSGPRDDRPQRSGPPRSGPPRSGPPRSGPPRSGPPRSGPPRGGPRSGPPRGGPRQGR
jgi:dihydropteroate synthase